MSCSVLPSFHNRASHNLLRINLLRLFVALACAALNLRNKQLSILVALSAAIARIAALLRTLNVLLSEIHVGRGLTKGRESSLVKSLSYSFS